MSSQPYSLRSRLNTQVPSLRSTPTPSPIPKAGTGLARKARSTDYALQLQRVIGTTTNGPSGLACCPRTSSYAYCAGAVAVLARLGSDDTPILRYFKARPTAVSLNPPTSHYESSPSTTPSRRRISTFTPRKGLEEYNGGPAGREWLEESGGQTWTARERIKTAACVALSRDGHWLAVGEAGYNPRVLLFSTAEEASCEVPTSIVTDHTYGLRCIAFSSDTKHLATLGDYKDGFLFVWSCNVKTGQLSLHSANKCTANIFDMTWCGNNVITVGTRCVRLWQIQDARKQSPARRLRYRPSEASLSSPGPVPLQSRNVLLGPMVDSTFTCAVSVDEINVVIGTETGQVCLVDISQNVLELKVLKKLDFSITSIAFVLEDRRLLVGTPHGVHSENFDTLRREESKSPSKLSSRKPRLSSIRRSLGLLDQAERSLVAIGTLTNHTITLNNDGCLQIQRRGLEDGDNLQPTFAAHKSVILGVRTLPESAAQGNFFTYSKNGEVKFWSSSGALLKQESLPPDTAESRDDEFENELTQMRFLSPHDIFIAGDRFGLLKLIKSHDWQIAHTIRAHSAEITSIDVLESGSLVATCSRDRMIQLFHVNSDSFELLQTMDDHVGSVNQVMFIQNGEKLLSCSTDRSLVIRERMLRQPHGVKAVAYLATKVLTLKGTPLSMAMASGNTLIVSTMDRRVTNVDISTGTLLESFKVGDAETDDTVFLNSMVCSSIPDNGDQKMLIGYCSMDKSIRVYNERNFTLLARESGHTEGVSDIALLEQPNNSSPGSRCTVISTGLDGTIMIWSISKIAPLLLTPSISQGQAGGLGLVADETEVAKPTPSSLPPLRKVLTKSDITELLGANGQASPSTPRSLSPVRLQRKTSRLALATSLEDLEETPSRKTGFPTEHSDSPSGEKAEMRRSPSPPPRGPSKLRSQRSRADISKDIESKRTPLAERSPSPPATAVSMPSTPKLRQKANNGRLRRPPSVPSDLRAQAAAQGRRQSMSQASDFGSMAMATDQATRMLKIYKKKLTLSKEVVDLDDLEFEISGLLKILQERKNRTPSGQQQDARAANTSDKAKVVTESEVDQLAVLLEGSSMTQSPTTASGSKDILGSNV
ncbi:WD domain-containing protein [Cladophialophora immunda]|nr:WD domain-containing protein [Cladophialophora immunda]